MGDVVDVDFDFFKIGIVDYLFSLCLCFVVVVMVWCIRGGRLVFVFISCISFVVVVLFGEVMFWCSIVGFLFVEIVSVFVFVMVMCVSFSVSLGGKFLV